MDYSYYSDYGELSSASTAAGIAALAGAGIFLLILLAVCIAVYVICSLALKKIAKAKGIENAWLAWIPVANMYILGKVVGPFNFIVDIAQPELVLPIVTLLGSVLSKVPVVGLVCSLASLVLSLAAYYFLYKQYKPEKATTMLVLTIFFSIICLPLYLSQIAKMATAGQGQPQYQEPPQPQNFDQNNQQF